MQKRDEAEFFQLVSDVLGYYRQDASKFVLSLWWEACKGYDLDQISKALTKHATDPEHGKFAPKVSDVVRQLSGTVTDRAAIAWGKAFEAMGSVGAYTDLVFDDPAIHAVIEDLGGWPKCCRTETSELSYLQHRFCESYRAYAGRGKFDYPRRLNGDRSPDHEYEKKGLPLPKPATVGDVDQCRLVYRGGELAGKAKIGFQSITNLQLGAS